MVFLVLNATVFSNLVVCVHQDGQMAVEAGIGNICGDAFQPDGVDSQAPQASQYKKTCIDVPLSSKHTLMHLSKPAQTPGSVIADATIAVNAASFTDFTGVLTKMEARQLPQPPPLKPRIHRFLRTVVLLT